MDQAGSGEDRGFLPKCQEAMTLTKSTATKCVIRPKSTQEGELEMPWNASVPEKNNCLSKADGFWKMSLSAVTLKAAQAFQNCQVWWQVLNRPSMSSQGLIWKVLQCPCSGRNCWREGVFLRDLSGSQGQQVGSEDNHACWGGLETWLPSPDHRGGWRKAPPASCSPTSWCVPWHKCP